jgi:hypothetical protein
MAASADDGALVSRASETEEALRERNLPRPRNFVEAWQVNAMAPRRTRPVRLDAEPLLRNFLNALNNLGIPVRQHHDPGGLRAIGLAASIDMGDDYPAVNFHIADRCPNTLTAFYRGGRRGLSWAFSWPVERFTLRLEGGDNSEFGSYAIAGVQWNHPRLPLAIGIGLPVRMRHADGMIGGILQLRAKLN